MLTRKEIEKEEEKTLAPYASKSINTKGRVYKEKEHDYRSAYQRDKDRIIYSSAFRRLEYKTQVFVNHEGDYYRTRLTHTLEVVQIAKTIARALRLNQELVEAISLAHDLGHTPFGHSGEDTLSELMREHGGFDHNVHGLRVVDFLEKIYPDFPGLNLTYEVREGIIRHSTAFDDSNDLPEFDHYGAPTLETQVVDAADEIAYDTHDLDDGLASGLLKEKSLTNAGFWKEACKITKSRYPGITEKIKRPQAIRTLIDLQVTDLIKNSEKTIKEMKIKSLKDVRRSTGKIIDFSKTMKNTRKPLRDFLMKNLYQHYRVIRMSQKASRIMHELFRVYTENPEQLPPSQAAKLKNDNMFRIVGDYIAGMTDRYAIEEYKKFFDPYEKV